MALKSPFKWVGGKTKLLPLLTEQFPKTYNGYFEPFLGGGSVLLNFRPKNAIVGDLNQDLIQTYLGIKESPQAVISLLSTYSNDEAFYYEIRNKIPEGFIETAARFLYLNHAGFNGLYRVNKNGKFNVSYGKRKKLSWSSEKILAVSQYLNESNVELLVGSYKDTLKKVSEGDFVYLDPPYFETFTGYTSETFGNQALLDLTQEVERLVSVGAKVLVSNANNEIVKKAFEKYTIIPVSIAWTVGQKGISRAKKENEILIKTW